MSHVLPTKLPQYLVRLQGAYSAKRNPLGDLIAHCRYLCVEETAYDNWNGGMDGHDVALFVPLEQLARIDIDDHADVCSELTQKLNKCATGIDQEWFNQVRIELTDESDPECQRATPFTHTPPANPDSLSFWKSGLARVFISHRDIYKKEARELSDALSVYGMSCFVAHDTIKPLTTWRNEILKGLQTMEVMLAFITDDFGDSLYCNQEIGYALGKSTPIVSLQLSRKAPPGFISETQAVRASIDRPIEAARKLFPVLGEVLGRERRLDDVLIRNFIASPSYSEAKSRFELMNAHVPQLSPGQEAMIVEGFRDNDQLNKAGYLTSSFERLRRFMDKTTDGIWIVDGIDLRRIRPDDEEDDDDVPF